MPIYAPGKRDRHNRRTKGAKRSAIASLSLTAMVDMFTVLAVFLLQNYNTTGEVIELSDEVKLPKASAVKELKPAHVIRVSRENILFDKKVVALFLQVKEQQDWKIENLFNHLQYSFKEADQKRKGLGLQRLKDAANEVRAGADKESVDDDRRITVQADKTVDFLTIKKVLYTLTEAGASEINFAVIKDEGSQSN